MMTKRELFAAMAAQGILANSLNTGRVQPVNETSTEKIAEEAVKCADALINELNKE